jgi:FkbM family methyltransferase
MSADHIRRSAIGASIRVYRLLPGRHVIRRPMMRLLAGRGERIADVGPFRMHVDLGEMIEARIYYTKEWEPETVAVLPRLVRPGDTVIDVGAHVGFITLHLANLVGPTGTVHAFEASRWAHGRLQANLRLNGLEHVTAHATGVSDHSGVETLTLSHGYRLDGQLTGTSEEMSTVALDSFLDQPRRVALIKTDTDGLEPKVLSGAHGLIERDRPAIIFEVAPRALRARGIPTQRMTDELAWLERLGYRLETEHGKPVREIDAVSLVRPPETTNVVALPR